MGRKQFTEQRDGYCNIFALLPVRLNVKCMCGNGLLTRVEGEGTDTVIVVKPCEQCSKPK